MVNSKGFPCKSVFFLRDLRETTHAPYHAFGFNKLLLPSPAAASFDWEKVILQSILPEVVLWL